MFCIQPTFHHADSLYGHLEEALGGSYDNTPVERLVGSAPRDIDTMIKHIVMWNLSGESTEEKRQAANNVKARFEGLAGQIPGLLHIEIGIDVSKASYACDVVLYSEFDSEASLAAYADHPAHLDIRNELKNVRIARYQVDYVAEQTTASPLLQPWSESVAARK